LGAHPQSEVIRVAVADATRMNSQLIVGALKRAGSEFDVRELPNNSSNAVRELQSSQPDVALISARLEDGPLCGFKILNELHANGSRISTVMLLDTTEKDLVIDSFRGGARGVFCRDSSFNTLPKCIRHVFMGQSWVTPQAMEFLLELVISTQPLKVQATGGMARLTHREKEVVRHLVDGLTNQQIADRLNLSEHTIRNYLIRVYDKLGMSTRVEVVLYALSAGTQSPNKVLFRSAAPWPAGEEPTASSLSFPLKLSG
jgi:two-component system, NarL family, nitrate/nitrite response regulator NarL